MHADTSAGQSVARTYEQGRPGYARVAIAVPVRTLRITPDALVVDIGTDRDFARWLSAKDR